MIRLRHLSSALVAIVVAGSAHAGGPDPYATAPPYLVAIEPSVTISPLATVGQIFEHATGEGELRFVGVPDGTALVRPDDETMLLYVNHEIDGVQSDSVGNRPSGARITKLHLDTTDLSNIVVRAARYAIDRVFDVVVADEVNGDVYAEIGAPGPIYKFCSSTLVTPRDGFTGNVYLTAEEVPSPRGFDGQGGMGWMVYKDNAYTLPRLGHGSWENPVAVPDTGPATVVFMMEDPRAGGDNKNAQLYMYVGTKVPTSADPVAQNGFSTGKFYVMKSGDPTRESEDTFVLKGTTIPCEWVELDPYLLDSQIEANARAAGSFNFFRIEDGEYDDYDTGVLYFTTTGHPNETNAFGRLYEYNFDPLDPLAGGTLTILLDGSEGMVGPDNIDINRFGELLINEDPNNDLFVDLGLTRDSSIWLYDTEQDSLIRLAEIDRPSAIAHALAADVGNANNADDDFPGGWESSGALDAEVPFGAGSWIVTVQAHGLDINPNEVTVQGGQVLVINYQNPARAYPPLILDDNR